MRTEFDPIIHFLKCLHVIIQFLGVAIVGIVESYFKNELNEPSCVVAEQVGILLERNL
ncbi:hypothetical protein [Bacillus sp. TL12]|uniref:hypothetical protein n=1 Tax=Bacillus sp. TL12 TaxID=2894756 RepID=UPI001F51C039|nr:hypothetical protein [Bacillus sp. TL12]MCI0767774.1 hypothetical protein [Bacillus sp. TL12]